MEHHAEWACACRYQLTSWAIKLNELTPGLQEELAPTDCRLRPDQHATEVGMYDEANSEKLRLEQKQRAARKAADRGDPIKPLWFDVRPEVGPLLHPPWPPSVY